MKCKALGIAAVLFFAASALAEDVSIKPGLWHLTTRHTSLLIAFCITPEIAKQETVQLAREIAPLAWFAQDEKCATHASPKVGNTVKISYTCTEPPSSGEGEITFQSDTAYSVTIERITQNGQKEHEQSSGRWLGADCGKAQPHN
ncbi:MAG: DUF3617 domain-containing protein [Zoogloeaceae bacterium]|jgi:hypothetical protein|nr:DUF3617 domain-containing protein [Zoogloeaceae bacterium]